MSEGRPAKGVLVAHGLMAQGMVDAVRRIAGVSQDALTALSNEGKAPQTLQEELDTLLGDDPAVVFTDLGSGSCALAARVCCRSNPRRVVVFGANLPMLLEFVFNRHRPFEELIPRLLAKGREGLGCYSEGSEDAHRPVSS